MLPDTSISAESIRGMTVLIVFLNFFTLTILSDVYLIPEWAIVFITLFCSMQNKMRFGKNKMSDAAAAIP